MSRLHSPILVVDLKYNIIRIHRSTFAALGNPKYIELIVSPSHGKIGIRAQNKKTPSSQKINASSLALQRSIQLYSTGLIKELQYISPDWEDGHIYKMEGVLVNSEGVVIFDVAESEVIHSDEYAEAQ